MLGLKLILVDCDDMHQCIGHTAGKLLMLKYHLMSNAL